MPSLKEVKTRISSVGSTRKITSAMKMVASAKLHQAEKTIQLWPVLSATLRVKYLHHLL